jgi:hypothetical protein
VLRVLGIGGKSSGATQQIRSTARIAVVAAGPGERRRAQGDVSMEGAAAEWHGLTLQGAAAR